MHAHVPERVDEVLYAVKTAVLGCKMCDWNVVRLFNTRRACAVFFNQHLCDAKLIRVACPRQGAEGADELVLVVAGGTVF